MQSFGPVDPFQLVKEEIDSVSERLRRSIFTGIPTLRSAAQYFFKVSWPPRPCIQSHDTALVSTWVGSCLQQLLTGSARHTPQGCHHRNV
jgi:hypothetical protein